MSVAKVISLIAQPFQSSYLSFEVGGILDQLHVDLGVRPKYALFEKLSDALRSPSVTPGDLSRHKYDSAEIVKLAKPFTLATLRTEMSKAALDTAINTRQNVYFSKHENSSSVISTIRGFYSKSSATSKPNLLGILNDIANEQATVLQQAYMDDDRIGVVKSTSSTVETETSSSGNSERGGRFVQEAVGRTRGAGANVPDRLPESWRDDSVQTVRFITKEPTGSALTVGNNYEQSRNNGTASGKQSAYNVDYEYRTPYLETRARRLRAHISLMDQKFESFMFEQNIPHLEKIFENELASIDNDVYGLQIVLLRSFLISPIPGIVTGIYKSPGEAVSPGEPVVRVENNNIVRLIANLMHRGPISIGSTATVTTTLFGPSSPVTALTGSVVATRGQGDRDRWEVIVQIDNVDEVGNHIIPLGYCFDREFTALTIS